MSPRSYAIVIGRVHRELPVVRVAPGLALAILDILGDTELVEEAARLLAERLNGSNFEILATPETKSIPLAHALSRLLGRPYVVFRKSARLYMGETLSVTTRSITAQREQTLYLAERDRGRMTGRSVLLVDDVVSTGSTLEAMDALVGRAGGRVSGSCAIAVEGEAGFGSKVVHLVELPLFGGA